MRSQHLLVIYLLVSDNSNMANRSHAAKAEVENRRNQLRKWIDTHFGGRQSAFVEAHRLNQGEISSLLKDKSFGSVKARNLEAATGMPPRYLEAIADEVATTTRMPFANVEPVPSRNGSDVPLISWVQAGTFCEPDGLACLEDVERFMACPVPHSPATFALRVRGDSMTAQTGNTRSYPEGSIIYIDPERRSPVNGDRVVACLDNSATYEVTFKVYKNEDGKQWLMPLNPMHPPIRERFRIIGLVIGQWIDD